MSDAIDRLAAALADRYRIERELGAGGMATVYLAEDLKHKRRVALKVLRPELAAVLGAERFVQEIETTANLQHPHILPLFDSGEADSFLYYVMPYIEGETLRDKLDRETQLGIDEAVKITTEVADALDYAHRHNVIHRDIKPENILLHDGRPVVSDFGIALAVSAAAGGRMTETGMSLGTPHYMSPEQATAEKDLTNRSDIYSLGAVLYEMLAGEPPHTGGSAQQIVMKIVADEARPVVELRKSVPPHVAAATERALQRLAADRFRTANEFADALTNPAFAFSIAQLGPVAATSSRGPWKGLSIATTGLALVMTFFAVRGWLRPAPEPPPTVRSTLDLGGAEFFDFSARMIISPDGRRLAFSGRRGEETGIYVRDADEADFHLVPGTRDGIYPAFSPDGEWIAYTVRAARTLFKVSLAGGAPQSIYQSPEREPIHASWDDDGWIVFWRPGDQVFRVRDAGGDPEVLLEGEGTPANPRMLPGGAGLIFGNFTNQTVNFLPLGGDSSKVVVPNARDPRYVEATGHLLWSDRTGSLFAAPFDPARGELTGDQRFVLADLDQQAGRFARYDFSRNGTLVYSSAGIPLAPLAELVVVHLDGSTEALELDARDFGGPTWSPDGLHVAYHGEPLGRGVGRQIFIYDVERRTAPRQLTNEGTNADPHWSPDGIRIAFRSVRSGTLQQDLFVVDVDDGLPPEPFLARPLNQRATDWPEANRLVFIDFQATSAIMVADLEDTVGVREYYAPEVSWVDHAQVSPDGTLLAYMSDESGRPEIYVRGFPNPGPAVHVSERAGASPNWSPDGRVLYYVDLPSVVGRLTAGVLDGAAQGILVAATIQRGPNPSVRSREELFPWPTAVPWSDLHPDGDRFITTRGVGEARPAGPAERRTFIVTNWFAELRERVGNE